MNQFANTSDFEVLPKGFATKDVMRSNLLVFFKRGYVRMIIKARNSDYDVLCKMDNHISKERLKKKIEDGEILLLIKEEKIIGWLRYGYFWDEHPFMNMLFIIDGYRGMGFGKKLVKDWEEKMAREGHDLVMTSTLSNEEAQHFYRRLGYVDFGGFIVHDEPLELLLTKNIHSPKCHT